LKSKKEFAWAKAGFILIILVVLSIIIFPPVYNYISAQFEEVRIERLRQAYLTNFNRWIEYENLVAHHAARALNPLKIKSINLLFDRLSATELLRIIKYNPQIIFHSQERDFWVNSLSNHLNFLDVIIDYGVGEDIFFQMPSQIPHERSVSISSDEMVIWIVENIFGKEDTLKNIPVDERDTSYLLYKLDFWGDIEYTIFRR